LQPQIAPSPFPYPYLASEEEALNEARAVFNATSPEAARKVYVHRVT
jgi:hypothetical protein